MSNRYRSDKDSFAARRERKVHPIWQILGWIWMVLLVIIASTSARLVSQANREAGWLPVSQMMAQQIRLPNFMVYSVRMDFNLLIAWLPGYPFYMDELILFLAFLFVGFGLFSVVYAFLYSRIIPIRSPLEAPEVEAHRRKPQRY
jgi:hypothetical protein